MTWDRTSDLHSRRCGWSHTAIFPLVLCHHSLWSSNLALHSLNSDLQLCFVCFLYGFLLYDFYGSSDSVICFLHIHSIFLTRTVSRPRINPNGSTHYDTEYMRDMHNQEAL